MTSDPVGADRDTARKHIRGSSLLLVGRIFAIAINFATQVLVIRYLSKRDYGALAYALLVVELLTSLNLLGLDKAVSRFAPIYQEKHDYRRLLGLLLFVFVILGGMGFAIIAVSIGLIGFFGPVLSKDLLSLDVLVVAVALVPVTAFDNLLIAFFAVFVGARAIFFRRRILGPLLKLLAVASVVFAGGNVFHIAAAHVAAGLIGLLFYSSLMLRLYRGNRLGSFSLTSAQPPVREVFSFALPLLSSDVVLMLRGAFVAMLLEYFHGAVAVASYRAVVPVARLNLIVIESFTYLFVPIASRLYARKDLEALGELHRRTTLWLCLLSFPIFLTTFALATPLTVLLFGSRYADSGPILLILSLAFFFQVACGFNALTLRVLGRVGTIVAVDAIATVYILTVGLLVIPRSGPVGAALVFCSTVVLHAILNYAAAMRQSHLILVDRPLLLVWGLCSLIAATIAPLALVVDASVSLMLPVVGVAIFVFFMVSRRWLDVAGTFPEVSRVPIVGQWLAADCRVEPAIVERLTANWANYFPGDAEPTRIVCRRQAKGSGSNLYWLSATNKSFSHSNQVVVKVRPVDQQTMDAPCSEAPSLLPPMSGREKLESEARAHRELAALVQQASDPGFWCVRLIDVWPQLGALVLESAQAPTFAQLMFPLSRLTVTTRIRLEKGAQNAARYLRRLHACQLERPPQEDRLARRQDVDQAIAEFCQYIAQNAGQTDLLQKTKGTLSELALRELPEAMPLGMNHGDFTLSNVFVDEQSAVAAIDTFLHWRAPIYEDIARWLVSMKSSTSRRDARHWEQLFLEGYFGAERPPIVAIRIFEALVLLNQWTWRVRGYQSSTGWKRIAKRGRLVMYHWQFARRLRNLLDDLRAADRSSVAASPSSAESRP